MLLTGEVAKIDLAVAEAQAAALVADLVNTPAEDMGPAALEAEAERIAKAYKAELEVVRGDALETGFPMVHAVGRAADRKHAPRLIHFTWGDEKHPRVAIVGKGVCFDSGGLDIKPAAGMLLMKKDMGGAAHALALAELIMRTGMKVRLHCVVPAVENAISGQCLPPRRRAGQPQGPDGRNRQYRCRRAAGAWRCAGASERERTRPDYRFRHADRRGAGGPGAGLARAVHPAG